MHMEKTTATNVHTGQTREFEWDPDILGPIVLGLTMENDECTGPCMHTVEADAICPHGWPARGRAAGLV